MRCYIVAEGEDARGRIERKIITKRVKISDRGSVREFLSITGSNAVRAEWGRAFRQSKIKGNRWRPMICLDDGKNNRKNTGLDVPYGDGRGDSNIVNTFTFGDRGSVGVRGPRMILMKCGREKKVTATKKGCKED